MSAKIPRGHPVTQASPLDLLKQARIRFTQREIAAHVGKDIKTVRRWEKGETPCPARMISLRLRIASRRLLTALRSPNCSDAFAIASG